MSDSSGSDSGETPSNYLEKITPKDLVMFSPKNDYQYLGIDYDIEIPENMGSIRVWGLPFFDIRNPGPIGILSGLAIGFGFNKWKKRPIFSSIHLHIISGLAIGITAKLVSDQFEKRKIERELIVWDYVKKHPQDFPEVFNPPKKYGDILAPWRVTR